MHIIVHQYFELLSLLVAIYCRKGLRAFSLQAFIPLLAVVNIIEIIGINSDLFGWPSNHFIYNFNLLLATPFQLYLLGKMLRLKGKEKPVFFIVSMLCMLIIILNYFFLQGPIEFNTNSLILIEVLMVVFSCFVLLRIALQYNEEADLLKEPYFWINSAQLLFALVTLVVLGALKYNQLNNITIGKKSIHDFLMPPANIILYSVYSYAFILCRIQKNKLSSLLSR